jgi:hypothetical protein
LRNKGREDKLSEDEGFGYFSNWENKGVGLGDKSFQSVVDASAMKS